MASVWVARLRGKRGFEKLVAIKTILPKFAKDPRFERMFLDEAALAARIEHANVAQVLDLGEEHNVLYLSMELVDGDALSKLLSVVTKKDLRIPPGIALRLLADTCGGLHAAHEVRGRDGVLLNVVHRDVSPQNILVGMNGVAKLIDFGIAKARDRISEDTSEGQLKGKIHYMAPEQALGKADRRSDIFAVGAILYFLLAGRPPFAGENELSTLFNLSSGRPPPALPPSVHPKVSAVVLEALAHQPELRFATAAAMQEALEAAMLEAGLVTTTGQVAAFVQEHMGDRAKKRKEKLDLALSAAAQRAKIAKVLQSPGADTPSGHGLPPDGSGPVSSVEATYATVLLGPPAPRLPSEAWGSATPQDVSDELLEPTGDNPFGQPRRKLGWVVGSVLALFAVPAAIAFLGHGAKHAAVAHPPTASADDPAKSAPPLVSAPVVAIPPSPSAAAATDAGTLELPAGSASSVPTVPWSSLPVAAPARAAPVRAAPPRPPPPPVEPLAKPAPTATTRHRVNDGF
jgi:serine/threonine-protein kinase